MILPSGINLSKLLATISFDYKNRSYIGGRGALEACLADMLKVYHIDLSPEHWEITIQHLKDLETASFICPDGRCCWPDWSVKYKEAVRAQERIAKFRAGDDTVYKKKRYKTPSVKKGHRKHHPDSEDVVRDIPWNAFRKQVRAKLARNVNDYIDDDQLYCFWEEDLTISEVIALCRESYENGEDV